MTNETGSYVLGSKLIKFGMVAADHENVLGRITPYLEMLSKKSNCSVTYSVWTENGPMVIKLFNSNAGYNIGVQAGTILPLASATGKTFLTFKEQLLIEEWKEKELKKLLPEQREAFEEELQRIREKEISFAAEPIVPSVSSVSFPVFNHLQQLLGAVAVVGFSEQIPKTEDEPLSLYIKEISKQISAY